MPHQKLATQDDIDSFDRAGMLKCPKEEAQKMMDRGELAYEESLFSDPGDDYTKIVNRKTHEVAGFWPGF